MRAKNRATPTPSSPRSGVTFDERQLARLELRLETFNLLNHFNWGNPAVNFNAGTFGRITTAANDPRIIQFGVKYDF